MNKKQLQSLNPLFIGACIRTPCSKPASFGVLLCLNPLFIGACIRTGTQAPAPQVQYFVSTPSSSGPVFGPKYWTVWFASPEGLNPLFIGACIRTRRIWTPRAPRPDKVSTPSSSGPVFGPLRLGEKTVGVFLVSTPSSSGPVFGPNGAGRGRGAHTGLNPLFIGACIRTHFAADGNAHGYLSQPPLHRGLYSDPDLLGRLDQAFYGLNPLFIGACIRTHTRRK